MRNLLNCVKALLCICMAASTIQAVVADESLQFSWADFGVSKDGKQIAYPVFVYDDTGDPVTQVWVADINGSNKKQISSVANINDVGWFDNSHAAIMSTWGENNIVSLSLDGKKRDFSLKDRFGFSWNVISPNVKWVAFASYEKSAKKPGIFLLDVNSGNIKTLSSDLAKTNVAWSPDSRKIAYGEGGYQKDYKLKIIDIESGKLTDTGESGVGASWSPDGKSLAYTGNVVDGGYWVDGVPVDGSIKVLNLDSKKTTEVSDPSLQTWDEKTKISEFKGGLNPAWSPDGKKIAYRRKHVITTDGKLTTDEDEIWVVNADGSNRRRIGDKWSPFHWAPDSKTILVKTLTGIESISVENAQATPKVLVAWNMPVKPEIKEQTISCDGVEVTFSGVKIEYAKALMAISAEARKLYANKFGFNTPEKLTLSIKKSDNTQLWTDGNASMFLEVSSNDKLGAPSNGGAHNIYGMCHEIGHMVMYRKVSLMGMPKGIPQGWADYIGSVVVDYVYKKLGANVWPQPYNYADVEGTARIARSAKDPEPSKDDDTRASIVFYKAHLKYGEDKVIAAMKTALDTSTMGKDVMPRFADALAKITNDDSARAMVPEEFLTPKVEWKVAEREINDTTTKGQMQEADKTGIVLKYDDGSSDGQLSTAGAGHAIAFFAPSDSYTVDSIQIYGSRYGEQEPPKENFSMYICDQDFNVIQTIEKPYSTFENSDPKWYTISFDPVKVPRSFYVCAYFNPTAYKGVFMHFDKNVEISHSRAALPWTFISDLSGEKRDWMIRAHLVKG